MVPGLRRSTEPVLLVRTLGAFEVRAGDGDLVLGSAARRKSVLLKFLLGRPEAREAIEIVAAELWPHSNPDAARVNVRGALHALRSAFAPYGAQTALSLEGGTVALDLERLDVDAFDFERRARGLLAAERVAIDAALALAARYGGCYLAGDEFEPWSCGRRSELADLFRAMLARALDDAREAAPSATLELERRALLELELEPDDDALALALARRYTADDRRGDARELARRCIAWGGDPSLEARLLREALAPPGGGPAPPREPAWQRIESPRFRGRELEVARIGDALDMAFDGRGGTIAILGDAGVGKTRLAGEVLAEAQDRAALAFAVAFEPGVASLGAALGAVDGLLETLDRRTYAPLLAIALRPLIGSLRAAREWYPASEPLEALPHPYEAKRQRAALVRVLETLSAAEPLVVLFDDAHAADDHGCALIARSVALTATNAFLALVAARSGALDGSPLAEILDQAAADVTGVVLGELDEESASELARETAEGERDPDVILERAGRNPAAIVREARAGRDDVAQRAREGLDALDARARRALFFIALQPRVPIAHADLACVLDCDDDATMESVECALAYRTIVERRNGYALASPALASAVLAERTVDERADAHRRLAELAARRLDAAAAAEHYTQAGPAARDAALVWTDRAIDEIRFVATADRLEVLRRADGLATHQTDPSLRARIALARGRAETAAGSVESAREALERGYALAADPATRARALLELAYLDAFAHRVAEALAMCDRVRELPTGGHAPDVLGNVHVMRAQLLGALGNVAACESAFDALETLPVSPAMRVTALNALGSAYLNAGRFDDADARYAQARAIALECGASFELASIESNVATLALRRGRFAQARDAYELLAREAILDGHLWAAAVRTRNAAECEIYLGDCKRADATLALAERRARRTGNPGLVAEMQLVRGTLERERGDFARARTSLEAALGFFGSGRMLRRELEGLAHLLDVCRRANELDECRPLIERGRALVAMLGEIDEVPYFFANAAAAAAAAHRTAAARELERRGLDAVAGRTPSNRAIETYAALAETRLALGERAAALAHLARAKELACGFDSPRYERWFGAIEARATRRR